jgi:hypothetical protein
MEDAAGTVKNKSMRKSQKKQIENMLDLLDQAHTAIKKAVETGNTEIALTLLEQAQDSAIQVGGMIEESLGEEFATVRILESYCEQVYQSYEMIRQQQAVNIGKVYKSLRRELIRMENSVKNDIPIRTSVVFLPYKASMWDSLESVWKAADADPDCDAYVIPIPYFDKNPDGSFSRMHYEGDLYPKDVPVVSWEEFDLAREYPDIIYIHNPYDECNHVTSVHPAFYARELRKFTDKLVYIPYFILPEINPDDQVAIDGMKHFCFTPGTIYAHQVIVQSEDMRQIYINEYSKAAKEMGLSGEHVDRKFLEKKFLGTGSPKIDKVLSTKKEDLEIPAEWLKVIEKSDGSWKKIIFYNTGVSALLQHSERMLRKMESVFEAFRKDKDEVILLWRPHPLIQATIESMRPQLWAAYRDLRDRYVAAGWGIYDDSADMDRAVILSDAYYGDHSSVMHLYQKIGKPILIQNVDAAFDENSGEGEIALNFRSFVRKGNEICFANMEFNGLFIMSLDTGEIAHIHTFSKAKPNEFFCVGQYWAYYQDKLIFFLNNDYSHNLYCYDLKTGEEEAYDFPQADGSLMVYYYIFVWRNKGLVFPSDMSMGCYVIDLDTMRITRDENMSALMADCKWGMRVIKQSENSFSFVNGSGNELIVVDVEEKEKTVIKLPVQNCGMALASGQTVWMTVADSADVYEWNREQNILRKYILKDTDLWDGSSVPYANLIYIEEQDCLILLGQAVGHVLKTDRRTLTIDIAFDFPGEFRFVNNKLQQYASFGEVERIGDELWFYPVRGNELLIYNIREHSVRGIRCSVPMENISQAQEILACELDKGADEIQEGMFSLKRISKGLRDRW